MTTYYEEQERESAKSDYIVLACYDDDLQASWHTTRTYVYKLSEQKS